MTKLPSIFDQLTEISFFSKFAKVAIIYVAVRINNLKLPYYTKTLNGIPSKIAKIDLNLEMISHH